MSLRVFKKLHPGTVAFFELLPHPQQHGSLGFNFCVFADEGRVTGGLGIGSFDGVPFLPAGMNGAEDLPLVTYEMLRRGYSETRYQKSAWRKPASCDGTDGEGSR